MESDVRFFRRRAIEELAAASRAVTPAARDRRIDLARRFLGHLDPAEARDILAEWGIGDMGKSKPLPIRPRVGGLADVHA